MILKNLSSSELYQHALEEQKLPHSTAISSTGALIVYSGKKTGRSPLDKRIVKEKETEKEIWWGNVNIPFSPESFEANLKIAKKFLEAKNKTYIVDGFAGWRLSERIKVRVICARAYHALFMQNMLIRPNSQELIDFGEPDWTLYNAGECIADKNISGVTSETSIVFSFSKKEIVILGTEYAGCMKKGVFTVLNFILPKKNILSMHASANVGKNNDVALFFGLSGTGKTTLSADPDRFLIGDDEHGWDEEGIFNFEGGCYAKVANLEKTQEPEIWNAIRTGTLLENVLYDKETRIVDFSNTSITENTRAAYPLEFISSAKIPALGPHPKNIFFLTCDAFGVLPPISLLTPEQAGYHFINGYSAKIAGTEVGINEPLATFSACFGAAFMVHPPQKYAELLKSKMEKYKVNTWLVNTGWSGGAYGVGKRIPLKTTRALISGALSGELSRVNYSTEAIFNLKIPQACSGVPTDILNPDFSWKNKNDYELTAKKLLGLFEENYKLLLLAEKKGQC